MTRALIIVATIATVTTLAASKDSDDWARDIADGTAAAEKLVSAQKKSNTPEIAADLQKQKQAAVKKIETIAETRPTNTEAQLAVGKSLASVEEAPRAVPYAERGLALAEASGDQKLVRDALLTGGQIYEKTGQYDLARDRAQRVLKTNPKDKEALALYMMVKDRVSTSASTRSDGAAAGGSGIGGGAQSGSGTASRKDAGSSVAMTSAASLSAQKYLAEGRRKMALDPKAALNSFDQAVAADPKSAISRVERSKARLASGDAAGALQDAEAAAALDSNSADAYALRAEAKRALGRKAEEMAADYETAAKLDGRYAEAYKTLLTKMGGSSAGDAQNGEAALGSGHSAPGAPNGMFLTASKNWRLFTLICALAAILGFILAPLRLRRRR
jgi:tetratricopeptide (TPR) repeat protein